MRLRERETLRYFATDLVGLGLRPGQERLVSLIDSDFEQLRMIVIRKGRRSGMTACAALVAAWAGTVLAPRFRERLLPGEEFEVTLVATSKDQAAVALGFVKQFLRCSAILSEQIVEETQSSVTLVGGCVITAVPCSARSSRGRANALVVLDEAAHMVDSLGNQSMPALLDALTPPLAQFGPLGLLLVISTPLDASGPFYELDVQASSAQFDDMAALHLPTLEAVPELAGEAERERLRNPRRFAREWLGEYTSGEESFPIDAYDVCVDPEYRPPHADPERLAVFALDGAVSRDAMALVGLDLAGQLLYARAWHPPPGGTIDHRQVLAEIIELTRRFAVLVVAYDPSQVHGLVLDALSAGLPMLAVSQAAGRAGGTMARHAAALVEALHERRLRLYPCEELREHVARSRFSSRTGGDRLVKARAADKIDLAVALALATGVLHDLQRENLRGQESDDGWELGSIDELVEFEPTYLQPDDPEPAACFGPDTSWEIAEAALSG